MQQKYNKSIINNPQGDNSQFPEKYKDYLKLFLKTRNVSLTLSNKNLSNYLTTCLLYQSKIYPIDIKTHRINLNLKVFSLVILEDLSLTQLLLQAYRETNFEMHTDNQTIQ